MAERSHSTSSATLMASPSSTTITGSGRDWTQFLFTERRLERVFASFVRTGPASAIRSLTMTAR